MIVADPHVGLGWKVRAVKSTREAADDSQEFVQADLWIIDLVGVELESERLKRVWLGSSHLDRRGDLLCRFCSSDRRPRHFTTTTEAGLARLGIAEREAGLGRAVVLRAEVVLADCTTKRRADDGTLVAQDALVGGRKGARGAILLVGGAEREERHDESD